MLCKFYQQTLLVAALLFWGTGLLPVQAQKQGKFPEKEQTPSHIPALESSPLFSPNWEPAAKKYGDEVRGGAVFNFDEEKAAKFLQENPNAFSLTLPTGEGSQTLTVNLQQSHIFGKDFKIFTSDNPDKPFDYKGGLHFHGTVTGDAQSKVAISVFDNEVMGLIITAQGTYNLGRIKKSVKAHILFSDKDLIKSPIFSCGTEDDLEGYKDEQLNDSEKRVGDCIGVYMEVDKSVVDNKGSSTNAINYVTGAFNQNVLLYNAESLGMLLSEMFVWTTADPYNSGSASTYLANFQAHTGAFNGDLGHLVAMVNLGGIAAGFSGICNPDTDESLCFSGILDDYENVPVFSFTVMILAHEMGHLIGSRHTHACVWNGNNTAIDGCAGYVETDVASCPLPGAPAGGGTIMSYCHNNAVGVNFNLGFGPQPGNVIRNTVANATCLESECIYCDLVISNVATSSSSSCGTAIEGSITVSATTSNGPITYILTGAATQTNNTGVFTGLPNGSYNIQVTDAQNCVKQTTATLSAGTGSTDVPKTISSSGAPTVTSTLNIAATGPIASIRLNGLDITHTWLGDLKATLTSPTGTVITLFDRPGVPATTNGCSGNSMLVSFDDTATLTAANFESTCGSTSPSITGVYRPVNPFSGFTGQQANGLWTLTITDAANVDGGALNAWSLDICTAAAPTCNVAISNVAKTNEGCPNANDGTITVTATGAVGSLTYTIAGPVNQSNGTGIFTGLPDGSYTVSVTDDGVANCSATATAPAVIAAGVDNTLPTVSQGTIAACYNSVTAAEAAARAATAATDNCPGAPTKTASTTGTCSAVITVRVTDANSNFREVTYNTRIDNTAPVVTQGSIAACYASVAAAEAAALAATSATDNCTGTLTETASTVGTCSAVITVTTTDGCGNSTPVTYNTRIDNTAPVVTTGTIAACYASVAAAEAAALAATTATDNCTGTLTETASTVGTCSAVITVTTTDGCGNSTSVTYNTRIDNTAPIVTTGTIAACYASVAAAEAAALAATTATDNCTGTLTETASTVGTCLAVITVTTTDGCGNSTPVTYNTRIDNTAPVATTGTIASCYTTVAAAEAAALAATTATDNCPGTLTETASTAGICSAVITVTTADGCGNSTPVTYNTRIDNTPPTVVCKNATVLLTSAGNYTLTATDVFNAGASSDNCPGALTVTNISPATVNCSNVNQTIPVVVTIQDGCGNTATCTAQITVQEGTALPAGWTNANIGDAAGSAGYKPCTSAGQFTLTARGFSNHPDLEHSAWRSLCGDGSITAHIASVNSLGWAGVEVRENATPGSKKVALKTQLSTIVRRLVRTATNATAQNQQFPVQAGQNWLRITRTGNNFALFVSADGVAWQAVGTVVNLALPNCVQIGLFAESINAGTITTAVFDHVVVTGGSIVPLVMPDHPAVAETAAPELQLYPNPTAGEITVDLRAYANRAVILEVYDVQGKVLKLLQVDAAATTMERIDLSDYQNGIYLLRAQSEGLPDATKRVVLYSGK